MKGGWSTKKVGVCVQVWQSKHSPPKQDKGMKSRSEGEQEVEV